LRATADREFALLDIFEGNGGELRIGLSFTRARKARQATAAGRQRAAASVSIDNVDRAVRAHEREYARSTRDRLSA
jgi:hypothetical protein